MDHIIHTIALIIVRVANSRNYQRSRAAGTAFPSLSWLGTGFVMQTPQAERLVQVWLAARQHSVAVWVAMARQNLPLMVRLAC
ncbi:MAG: hypothetical protein ABI972_20920 [Acidobacteriota bacterium]